MSAYMIWGLVLLAVVVAGLVLSAVLIPVGMGYAQASGVDAIYGLYATMVPLLVYALFGPSRILVLGPDSSLASLILAVVLPLAAGAAFAQVLAGLQAHATRIIAPELPGHGFSDTPTGVMTPTVRGAPRASAYRLNENRTIPALQLHTGRRLPRP